MNWPISGVTGVEQHDRLGWQTAMKALGWVPAIDRRPAVEESVIISYENGYETRAVVKYHFKNGSMRVKREDKRGLTNADAYSVWTKRVG